MAADDYTIISSYGAEYRGTVQYYMLAQNVYRFNRLHWVMQTSLLKTLAAKYNSTATKMARKYKAKVETPYGLRTCCQVAVERGTGRKPLVARFGGIPLKRKRTAVIIDQEPVSTSIRHRELISRLLAGRCERCGQRGHVEVHHVRKLANLAIPGQQPRPDWMTIMAKKRRKSLVVCDACHDLIHEYATTRAV